MKYPLKYINNPFKATNWHDLKKPHFDEENTSTIKFIDKIRGIITDFQAFSVAIAFYIQ